MGGARRGGGSTSASTVSRPCSGGSAAFRSGAWSRPEGLRRWLVSGGLPALRQLVVWRPGQQGCDGLRRVNVEGVDGSLTAAQHEVLNALADRGAMADQLLPDPATLIAPFADPMLKLAVLEALRVELPEMQFFDEYEFDDANLTRLLAIEVSQEQFDSIEKLDWFGEAELTFSVFSQYDGESGEFDIRSLEGIEALRNLRQVRIEPLDELPADQVAALRAKGVTVAGR
jgi:hypothetical protein